jgi:hypothetical protein
LSAASFVPFAIGFVIFAVVDRAAQHWAALHGETVVWRHDRNPFQAASRTANA